MGVFSSEELVQLQGMLDSVEAGLQSRISTFSGEGGTL